MHCSQRCRRGFALLSTLSRIALYHITMLLQGYSTLAVIANAPPSSGELELVPKSGIALETLFAFASFGWVDDADDLPLRFSFYYIIGGDDDASRGGGGEGTLTGDIDYVSNVAGTSSTTEFQLIADSYADSYSGAILPRGGAGTAGGGGRLVKSTTVVTGVVYVADQHDAASRAVDAVEVAPRGESVVDLSNRTAGLLRDAFVKGNIEVVFLTVVAAASVLNSPNCSLISGASCGTHYKRGECEVDRICGPCLAGFVGVAAGFGGVDGDHHGNAPCYPPAATCGNGALDGDESDTDCGGGCAPCELTGAACLQNSDCVYGRCDSGVCRAPPSKPCAGNCSSHGQCVHIGVSGTLVAKHECTVGAWWCSAQCECDVGWAGGDCTRGPREQAEVRSRMTEIVS